MDKLTIIGITPFERPDVNLVLALQKAGAFPVLHLGYSEKEALTSLEQMKSKSSESFGVCFSNSDFLKIQLPQQVSLIILPIECSKPAWKNVKVLYQVKNLEEARIASKSKVFGIIIKGNEGSGKVGNESSFILFQQIKKELNIPVWVQGGAGIHTSAALIAAGANGIILDSQLALFPNCSLPKGLKDIIKRLDGTETKLIDNYRVLSHPNSPKLPDNATFENIKPFLGQLNPDGNFITVGQDISFAKHFFDKFKTLENLIFGIKEAISGHLQQAKSVEIIGANNPLAKELKIKYPIAKGPMSSVSDMPAFIDAVAVSGGLPFLALSLIPGKIAKDLLLRTKETLNGKPWGVGVIGFAPKEIREEQFKYIEETRPDVVLIAGGRPSQALPLEKIGIKTFLHVPTVNLLDQYLKEGARRFIFEGRECGGHIGPLSSFVLWEQQIERLLKEDDAEQINVFFAGGIHDALSSSMVSVMAAPLAAKGVKVGILMGSSYLFTKDAVETGAILKKFQDQIISNNKTAVLESSPGHETRCLITPHADFFEKEKHRLEKLGTSKQEIWAHLESLNVGRLRVAAKGIEFKNSGPVKIEPEVQLETGIYMIGQATSLRNKVTTIEELHREVAVENNKLIQEAIQPQYPERKENALNIAVVGMACIYADAKNIDEYWKNIIFGKDSITEVPDERWNKNEYFDPHSINGDKTPSKWGGFIPTIDFDPLEFGIPPQSLSAIDPAQLLSLLVAKKALEDAGYDKRDFDRENTSVIFGVEGGTDLSHAYTFRALYPQYLGEIPKELDAVLPRLTEDSFPGILGNVVSGRIANRLDLGGRNYIVDAACASSLSALDVACQELALNKSEMVLAGGVDLHNTINDYLLFSSAHAVSKKGRCRSFDADADGMSLGEGVAVVILKRLEDAERDGDKVYCVIQGIGGSSDGKSLGLTAPRKEGQINAIKRAYNQAGFSSSKVGLMEAHGTGTVVGDRTELSSMTDVFIQSGAIVNQTHLGSVKTQVGHTKCAAGMAGFIKIALSVYHGIKPPTINLVQPNQFYKPALSPFVFNTEAGLWSDANRVAGVSAFGFGGTNFHAVIEGNSDSKDCILKSWPSELFVFRGESYEDAVKKLQQVKELLEINNALEPRAIAYTLATESNHPIQLTIVANDTKDLAQKIDAALNSNFVKGIYKTQPLEGKIAFMFPGQGSQRINMARDLFVIFPEIRKHLSTEYEAILFPNAAFTEDAKKEQTEKIKDTGNAQPILGMVDYAIASFLKDLGITPDMVAGHSYGEIPALCFANVFEEKHLVAISENRAQSILNAVGDDKGAMVAVNADIGTLQEIIKGEKDVWIVNMNSPSQSVLAGTTPAIIRVSEKLKIEKKSFRQLEVACAFHSPLLSRSEKLFSDTLINIPFGKPEVAVWSNTDAAQYPEKPEQIKKRMAEHLVKPVLYSEQIQNMYKDGARIFIEVGPGNVLTQLVKSVIGKDELVLSTEQKDKNGIDYLLNTLARFIASGREINFEKLFAGRNAHKLEIENPKKYKKSATTWHINGQRAIPASGQQPANAMVIVKEPLKIFGKQNSIPIIQGDKAEQLVQDYLANMKSIVQNQRDVMLSYLGQNPGNFTSSVSHSIQAQPQKVALKTATIAEIIEPKAAVQVITRENIQALLLDVIFEKTGYPKEMLGLDMNLEADLSIDSIKRTEIIGTLKSRLGGFKNSEKSEEEVMEQLAAIKTLNNLIAWVVENNKQTITEILSPIISEFVENNKVWTIDAITEILLETVFEKTGYPKEMLGMDMDLEADLSIDSIKRTEIIGNLKSKLGGFSSAGKSDEDLMEQLASIKTLNGLVSWIMQSLNQTEPVKRNGQLEPNTYANVVGNSTELIRYKFELLAKEIEGLDSSIIKGQHFGIAGNGNEISKKLKTLLEKLGAKAEIITEPDSLINYDGLIYFDLYLSSKNPAKSGVMDFYSYVKGLDHKKVKWIYAISDFQSQLHSLKEIKTLRNFSGHSGFLNSLDKEWEQSICRTINLDYKLSKNKASEIILNEILFTVNNSEVYYDAEKRQLLEKVLTPFPNGKSLLELNKDAVVIAFGGAQGITAETLISFSKEFPCNYILVGRTGYEENAVSAEYKQLLSKNDIRKQLLSNEKFSSPKELEIKTDKIYKHNQISHTIQRIEESGAKADYLSIDIRDEKALIKLLQSVYKKHDRIDGVIHGAGLLDDKFFHDKTYESFENVFATKVNPLYVLAENLKYDTKFLVCFSSIASVIGNRGQVDYAAANSVMDKYAMELKDKFKGRVLSINWGPWSGKGMISKELEEDLKRRGVSSIPLSEGTASFVNELKYGSESQVIIMGK